MAILDKHGMIIAQVNLEVAVRLDLVGIRCLSVANGWYDVVVLKKQSPHDIVARSNRVR